MCTAQHILPGEKPPRQPLDAPTTVPYITLTSDHPSSPGSAREVFLVALKLGLSSFGGPVAHLGYFERVYVRERHWLDAGSYAALVALCQILPGPASSQTGFLIGLHRAGWRGAFAAWAGFTLPSAVLMVLAAVLLPRTPGSWLASAEHGLQLAAVAVVAQAVLSMGQKLCRGWARSLITSAVAAMLLAYAGAPAQFAALALGATAGMLLCRDAAAAPMASSLKLSARTGWLALGLFLLLLLALPALATASPDGIAALAAIFYRSGALVFGGGHVVLPLLHDALVPGWIGEDRFLAGYGLAQALPGPLFTFSAYLGAASAPAQDVVSWSLCALVFIFLPGLLLAVAGAALWQRAAAQPRMLAALAGVNAAVVGLLAAALYRPLWTTAVHGTTDLAIALLGFILLQLLRLVPLTVVLACVLLRLAADLG